MVIDYDDVNDDNDDDNDDNDDDNDDDKFIQNEVILF